MTLDELIEFKSQISLEDPSNPLIDKINTRIKSITDHNTITENNSRFLLAQEFLTQALKVYELIINTSSSSIKDDINDIINTRLNRFIHHVNNNHECPSYNSTDGIKERYNYVNDLSEQFEKEQKEYEERNGLSNAPCDQYIPEQNPYDISYNTIKEASKYIPSYDYSDSISKHSIIFDYDPQTNVIKIINFEKEPVQIVIDNAKNIPSSIKDKLLKIVDPDVKDKSQYFNSLIDEFKSLHDRALNRHETKLYMECSELGRTIMDIITKHENDFAKARFYYMIGRRSSIKDEDIIFPE